MALLTKRHCDHSTMRVRESALVDNYAMRGSAIMVARGNGNRECTNSSMTACYPTEVSVQQRCTAPAFRCVSAALIVRPALPFFH